jgi:glutamate-1-semialdehyde 2,1-aminomutase
MDSQAAIALVALGAGATGMALVKARERLRLSFAKHPSLAGHPRLSRRFAALIRHYDMPADLYFRLPRALPVQQSRPGVREHLAGGPSLAASSGVTVTDLDGNVFLRPHRLVRRQPVRLRLLQGCIARGGARGRALGPVLGATIRCVADNVRGCARSPGSTRCRSTCPAPRR